jgi:hypothetical protein
MSRLLVNYPKPFNPKPLLVASASVVRQLGGSTLASEQDYWEDEVLDDGVVEMMNSQFEHFLRGRNHLINNNQCHRVIPFKSVGKCKR